MCTIPAQSIAFWADVDAAGPFYSNKHASELPQRMTYTLWAFFSLCLMYSACRRLVCDARQNSNGGATPLRTRLAVKLTSVPYRLDLYFAYNPWRKVLWSATSFSAGYYAANTVSLSFGALAINDVIAAATTVAFCEIVSKAYWSASSPGLALAFLNFFKLGVIAALIADAFKLS